MGGPTLTRFYAVHYILPFVIGAVSILHIFTLHRTGSRNPLGLRARLIRVRFHRRFTAKDMIGFMVVRLILAWLAFFAP